MKTLLTLDASIESHRELARLFVGCDIGQGRLKFIGFDCLDRFVIESKYPFHFRLDSIEVMKIDLSTPMDLRLAIGTDIEFEDTILSAQIGKAETFNFKDLDGYDTLYFPDWGVVRASEVKLSRDYLERIGAKVKEVESSNSMKRFDGDRVDYSKLKLGSKL